MWLMPTELELGFHDDEDDNAVDYKKDGGGTDQIDFYVVGYTVDS